MRVRSEAAVSVFAVVACALAFAEPCPAQLRDAGSGDAGGFGRLAWGVTVEQARITYPDLSFGSYVVEDARQEPSRAYYRKDESAEIDGVAFDSIQYLFKGDRFHGIRAVMHSRIGPRSLVTRSEESFDLLHRALTRHYGRPARYDERYFTDFISVVRVAEWSGAGAAVILEYKGPEGTNEDQLVLDVREGGRR